jgi:hypothetical protein
MKPQKTDRAAPHHGQLRFFILFNTNLNCQLVEILQGSGILVFWGPLFFVKYQLLSFNVYFIHVKMILLEETSGKDRNLRSFRHRASVSL